MHGRRRAAGHWINATGKFAVREVDGQQGAGEAGRQPVHQARRASSWGRRDSSDYTVEVDVCANEQRRQMGDAGVIAQRYVLVLFGNSQRIELQPWQPETARTVTAPFAWKADTWYRMKLRVENTDGRRDARAGQGVAGRRGRARRPGSSSASTRSPQSQGSPGLYADAPFEVFFDNLKVTANRVEAPRRRKPIVGSPRATELAARPAAVGLLAALAPLVVGASDPGTGDWPMWGGTPDRNMVSTMKGLPTSWDVAHEEERASGWRRSARRPTATRWSRAARCSSAPTTRRLRDPKQGGDRGVLMAFRETDGEFLWQITHEKLAAGRVNDWPYQGVCSSPLVEGDRVYYVSATAAR